MTADWRPERRVRDLDLLRILKLRWDSCALCDGIHDLHLHHLCYRSQGGDDVEANLVALCSRCHSRIHARDPDAWMALGAYVHSERPDVLAYLERKLGTEHAVVFFKPRPYHPSTTAACQR